MRIVDIRECAIPLKSDLRNSSIDFSEMTTSVVAVITDVLREAAGGRLAFNSTGRYACGATMRARFIPRIWRGHPQSPLDETTRHSIRRDSRRDDAGEIRWAQRALIAIGTIESRSGMRSRSQENFPSTVGRALAAAASPGKCSAT
jgi:hypothetical protein